MVVYKSIASGLLFIIGILWLNVDFASNLVGTPLYYTNEPLSDLGFDISSERSGAIRFSPLDDFELTYIELWFMNNSRIHKGSVTVTLRDDQPLQDGTSQPGDHILEQWTLQISALGWNVEKETLESVVKPSLSHDARYWLYIESQDPPLENPVWAIASSEGENMYQGYYGSYEVNKASWSIGYSMIPAVRIYGQLPSNTTTLTPQLRRFDPGIH